MGAHKPRSGSLAFYPRVRAKKHTARFRTFGSLESNQVKPLGFFGFKVGMVSVFGKNAREKSASFGQEVMLPGTVIECPPLKVIGARVYSENQGALVALNEVTIDKPDKFLRKKIKAFKKKGKKASKKNESQKYVSFDEIEKLKSEIVAVTLIVETQPSLTTIGRKKPDVVELPLSGSVDQQLEFAKSKFGKELRVSEVFSDSGFVDVKAVDKGKGFEGPVKRFGVKVHRPKAKKHRYVGSISPWHPATVMWTVPRAGQLGYQSRTEYNKKILFLSNNFDALNPKSGFSKYGVVKNEFLIVLGSVPGPAKRVVALRQPVRNHNEESIKFSDLKLPNEVSA